MTLPRVPLLLLLAVLPAAAQPVTTIYFSTRFTESPASGRAGFQTSQTAQCNPPNLGQFVTSYAVESAIANSPGISFVQPGVLNATVPNIGPTLPPGNPAPGSQTTDYVELVNFPQFNLIIGDLDGDGIPDEATNFSGVDAIWIPAPAPGRPNTVHEMFISPFSDSAAPLNGGGYLGGFTITEADMVLLPRAPNVYPAPSLPRAPVFFVREADWVVLLGLPGPNPSLDVDAFTVDPATGDIYVSFDGTGGVPGATVTLSNGGSPVVATIARGDIVRIPGTAYAPDPNLYGRVTNPVAGQAQVILSAAEVTAMVSNALALNGSGSLTVTPVNVYSLDFDPNGGVSAGPASGFLFPNLLFTVDNSGGASSGPQNAAAAGVYTTAGGGAFTVINGVTMNGPRALGYSDRSFNPGFWAGPLDAIAVVQHAPAFDPLLDRPLHLDSFPTSALLSSNGPFWTGVLTGYISNAAPFAQLAIFGTVAFVPAGGHVPRWDVSPFVPGYPDLYIDILGIAGGTCLIAPAGPPFGAFCQVPFLQPLLSGGNNPISLWTDPVNGASNGDTCFSLDLTLVVPPGAAPMSPPPLVVFQAIDLTTGRLSSPLSFQFN
jgi:hypothetical protein